MGLIYYVFLILAIFSLANGVFLSYYEKRYVHLHDEELMDDEII